MIDHVRISGDRNAMEPYWSPSRTARACWGFVTLGVLLRLVRYALNHPLWGDEAFLASNLIDRDFAALMRPLDFVQVCPILFLWIEKLLVLCFGFSTWSLRLVPTVASVASLVLFGHLARLLLRGPALVIAVGVVAVGYYPIRHGGEIKPYATDLLAAIALVTLAVEWLRDRDRVVWLWLLSFAGPLALAVSHPSIFVVAGVGVVLLVVAIRDRQLSSLVPILVYGGVSLLTFLLLLRGVTASQSESVMGTMRSYWDGGFPPRNPLGWPLWLLTVHTSHMFAYPAGGDRGASTLTTVAVAVGVLALVRRGSRVVLGLLLSPFAMGLMAAFLGRYPYGGSARTMQYAAPMICLLGGLGVAAILSRLHTHRLRIFVENGLIATLSLVGVGMLCWDFTHPYKSPHDESSRQFAQAFWEQTASSEVVCARNDLAIPLDPKSWRNDRSALYLCHQAIYSSRHRARQPARLDAVTNTHPLVAVVFGERAGDRPAVEEWLRSVEPALQLRSRSEHVVNAGQRSTSGFFEDRYVLYELVPDSGASRLGSAPGTRRDRMLR